MSSFEDSLSTFGNSSLSSFMTTLLENEEISNFEIVTDNAKPDQYNSITTLKLVPDEPKCRWNNLVREDSDPNLLKRQKSYRPRPTMAGRRINSDTSLMMEIPKRLPSPKTPEEKKKRTISKKTTTMSDSDLLRMPRRCQSPDKNNSRSKTKNAQWDQKTKSTDKKNMFFDLMIVADPASRSNVTTIPTCLKDALSQNLISFRKSSSIASGLTSTSTSSSSSSSDSHVRLKKDSLPRHSTKSSTRSGGMTSKTSLSRSSTKTSSLSLDFKKSLYDELGTKADNPVTGLPSLGAPQRVRSKASFSKN
mmetsp:Transcript_8905/g.14292  ORF Transcript_8905/g.14292 Transcript_8905/m.14292 type:complete len:306 (-) Transcript_8905:101-1018(-)